MAGPYLKSGESIILTTDRVRIDDKVYDVILTSHRVALVDSDHARDQPQVIPFATILSVKGGKTPAHEPFITLVLIDPVGIEDSTTLELVFSQQPYEDRSAECELWVRKLIEHIVSDRHEAAPVLSSQQPAKPQEIAPTVRRWVAPDVPVPHNRVEGESRKNSAEILSALQNVSWEDQHKESGESLYEEVVPETKAGQEPAASPDDGESIQGSAQPDNPETADAEPVVSVVSEEPAPEGPSPAVPEETVTPEPEPEVPVSHVPDDEESRSDVGIGREEPPIEPVGTAPPHPSLDDKQRLMAEDEQILLGKEAGTPPEPAPAEIPLEIPAVPEVRSGLPDTVVFPVIHGHDREQEEDTLPPAKEPDEKQPTVEEKASAPVIRSVSPRGIAALVIAGIVIACVAGAVFILISGGHTEDTNSLPITPAVSVVPTATPTLSAIPGTGVWVRVSYNGTYYGKYGNPGELREVRGTGDQFYPIKDSTGLVQASFEKLDNSGDTLTVGVYNTGSLVTQVAKRTPRASIAILVDPATGKAPYVPVTTTAS